MTEQLTSSGNPDSDGDIEMVVEQRVEGIPYDNRLETQFQPTLFQRTDKRNKLQKLRDGYDKNLKKLDKNQLRQLFRHAQDAGMEKTFTECTNKAKQQAAILEFYIEEFPKNGLDIKEAPIFNPKTAKNNRKQKQRKRTRTTGTTSTTTTGTTGAATATKKSHKGNVDPYKTLGQLP